jgi:hypothetical protein
MRRLDIGEHDRAQGNECSKYSIQNQSQFKVCVSDRVHLGILRQPDTTYCDFSRFASRPRKLEKRDVRFGTNFILKVRSKPYINAKFSLDYIRTVFLPNPYESLALDEFTNEDTVLLMDNCPSHVTGEVLGLLGDTRVRVTTWTLHITQIFQWLDISLLEF